MDAFFLSAVTVGVAELGDRSMFFALLLGLRYSRPWPIFTGMATGLFLNQAISALLGIWLFQFLDSNWHGWVVGIAFIGMAIWMLKPEDDDELKAELNGRQLFIAAAVGFFFLEMADKTQLAILALAGHYQTFWPVVLGGSIGILAVTAPALWLGYKFADRLPLHVIKWLASGLFLLLGGWILISTALQSG